MILDKPFSEKSFLIGYSIFLLVSSVLLVLCHQYWNHSLAHTLLDVTGLLVAPILYSAFFYSRRFYLTILIDSVLAVSFVFFMMHNSKTKAFMTMGLFVGVLVILCELIQRTISRQKNLESELLFIKEALETRVELRTAELQFLNRQLSTDLAMMRKADEARRNSETQLRQLINAIPDSILRIRSDGTCLEYKPGEESVPSASLRSKQEFPLTKIMPEKPAQQVIQDVQRVLQSQQPRIFEFQYEKQGMLHSFETRTIVMSPQEVLVLIRDMTDRRRLEKEILDISQREQTRIGQDLHDGLGQLLTGIACLLQGLRKQVESSCPDHVKNVHEISELVKQAISQCSWLARGLMPVKLELGGLESALQELVERTEQIHHVPCLFFCRIDHSIDHSTTAIQLYRITQEALNNAIKHSKAQHIWIRLQGENGSMTLSVKDDGIGLPIVKKSKTGLGLQIMHYRAALIGAELEIHSEPDGGTVIQCRFKSTPPIPPMETRLE